MESEELKGTVVGEGSPCYMTVGQLSRRWSISIAHAYKLLDRGDVPSLRIGCAVRVPISAVERYERRGTVS